MTSTDLSVLTHDEAALAELSRHAVVELLERGKTWLQQALQRDTEIGEFVSYKSDAAILRELTIQKELGKDAELAATELIRRAERAIGLAIRAGQETGAIRSRFHTGNRPNRDYVRSGQTVHVEGDGDDQTTSMSPTDFVSRAELAGARNDGIYALTDDVTDEVFEGALDEAKEEGNLSRANVVRIVRQAPQSSHQQETKRPEVLRKTRRFDSRTVIDRTVEAASNVVTPSLLAEVNYGELDTEELHGWISSLGDSIRALNSLKAQLSKELTHR